MTNAPNNPRITPALNPPTTKNTSIVDDLPTRSIDLSAPQYRSDGDLVNIAGYPQKQSHEVFLSLLTKTFNENPRLVKKLGRSFPLSSIPVPFARVCSRMIKHTRADLCPRLPSHLHLRPTRRILPRQLFQNRQVAISCCVLEQIFKAGNDASGGSSQRHGVFETAGFCRACLLDRGWKGWVL